MKQNPFEKSHFKCHRDWEASFIKYLAREAKAPDIRNWPEFAAAEPNVKTAAAFSALLLSDLVETRPAFRETVDSAYKFYKVLKNDGE